MPRLIVCVWLGLGLTFALHSTSAQESSASWPTEAWATSTPEEQGLNSETLAAMLNYILERKVDIHSVLVIRNGYLVLEAYRSPYTADTRHHLFSCTKSVTSALFGIAIHQGYIDNLDHHLLDYFPDRTIANLNEAKQTITLQHLLTMSSGLNWSGGILEPLIRSLWDSDDWTQFVLDRPMVDEPGAHFVYNSGGSNLLAVIIETAAHQSLLDFAQTNLFTPLGISNLDWNQDLQDHYLGGWGLWLTPRDMAKFGYLYLNNGQWDGQQIVPAEWVDASTHKQIDAEPLSDGYGYQWWVDNQGYYMALGYGGQYIIVKPELNLVVVFTSNLVPRDFFQPEDLLQRMILPAIEADEPLPANPDGMTALQAAIDALADVSE